MEKLEEKKRVAWCGCKHSNNMPYCDGSHRDLA
ncbi:MAG: CDGSH iron-sulfur domain-containing protein [Bacteroidota bacterium]